MSNAISITPFLTVANGREAVGFYTKVFDAVETKRFNMDGDGISSVLEIGASRFYVADEELHNGNVAPDGSPSQSMRLILESVNADEFFERAVSAGAVAICPMTTEEDWRIGKLRDPFGHVWEIGYKL